METKRIKTVEYLSKDDTCTSPAYSTCLKDVKQVLDEFSINSISSSSNSYPLDSDIAYQLQQLISLSKTVCNIDSSKKHTISIPKKETKNDIYNTSLGSSSTMTYLTQSPSTYSNTNSNTNSTKVSPVFSTFLVRPSLYINSSMSKDTLVSRDSSSIKSPTDNSPILSFTPTYPSPGFNESKLSKMYDFPPRKISLPTSSKEMSRFTFKQEFNLFNRKPSISGVSPSINLRNTQENAELFGWMHIYKTSSFMSIKQWKKRYIVFKEIMLYRFESASPDAICTEILQLNSQSIVCVTSDFPDQKFVLVIDNPGRDKFYIKAETSLQLTSWLNTLKAAVVKSSYLMRGLPPLPSNQPIPCPFSSSQKRGIKAFSKMYSKHQPINTQNFPLNC
ncbi:hypothetical protein K502DRAFT_347387 [Neoconidiobolus thromboides FSU 785]|nr:hypothetical protein K502DRAFT_347387 [Neoconidiobolus thromboides FSU 785]